MLKKMSMAVVGSCLLVAPAMAQTFAVDTVAITNTKADILAWGGALIGVALVIFAYKTVRRIAR